MLGLKRAGLILVGSISPVAPFPLTPALSLRERERPRPHRFQPTALDSPTVGLRFPLSLRERDGVRGKGAIALLLRVKGTLVPP